MADCCVMCFINKFQYCSSNNGERDWFNFLMMLEKWTTAMTVISLLSILPLKKSAAPVAVVAAA